MVHWTPPILHEHFLSTFLARPIETLLEVGTSSTRVHLQYTGLYIVWKTTDVSCLILNLDVPASYPECSLTVPLVFGKQMLMIERIL